MLLEQVILGRFVHMQFTSLAKPGVHVILHFLIFEISFDQLFITAVYFKAVFMVRKRFFLKDFHLFVAKDLFTSSVSENFL